MQIEKLNLVLIRKLFKLLIIQTRKQYFFCNLINTSFIVSFNSRMRKMILENIFILKYEAFVPDGTHSQIKHLRSASIGHQKIAICSCYLFVLI